MECPANASVCTEVGTPANPLANLFGTPHVPHDTGCPACRPGFPMACGCGGWVHAGEMLPRREDGGVHAAYGDESLAEESCDRCGNRRRVVRVFFVGNTRHMPNRMDCAACMPAPVFCECGYLIHTSRDGSRLCEGCGSVFVEIDF